ncbi:MAG: Ig domain-containing protein [Bacteroides sp.]|nr:Ig domain-containing protein [Bacteroides sp.]
MKKTLLLSLAIAAALPAMADLDGAGYYRVQNYKTNRYVSVIDNRGSIDFVATNADLTAIKLDRNFDRVSCDPASVLYIDPVGKEYNILTQGTSVHDIINHYVTISQNGSANGQKLYMAYGVYNGVTRYLGDQILATSVDEGKMTVNANGDSRKWYVKPIESAGDNYYGPKPSMEVSKGVYQGQFTTVYASFPMSAYSEGVKFYTIDKVGGWGQITLKEVTGVVPAATPIIVKCAGSDPAANRMNIGGSGGTVSTTADFKGVYFNCDIYGHVNHVANDRATMRVLGVCEDGTLGFIQSDVDYFPANTAYLVVPATSPKEFKCVTNEEFSKFDDTVVTLDKSEVTLVEGESVTLTATITSDYVSTDKTLTWTSSNESVATVNNGVINAVNPGTAQITVTLPNGNSATCNVTVKQKIILVSELLLTPSQIENYPDTEIQLNVTVLPDNATDKSVKWSSSNESVATVNENGLVKLIGEGSAVITVSAADASGVSATCTVTVKEKEPEVILVSELLLTPSEVVNYPGTEVQLSVTVLPEDATDKSVEWTTSDERVATVSENGLVKITGEGTAVVTVIAKDLSGISATCRVEGLSGIESVISDMDTADVYTLNGLLLKEEADKAYLSTLPKGMYILKVSGKAYKVVK